MAGGDPYGNVIYWTIAWSRVGQRLAAADDRNLYVIRADGTSRPVFLRGGGGGGQSAVLASSDPLTAPVAKPVPAASPARR
jgi:hypothetical protein